MIADKILSFFVGRVRIYADKQNKNALLSFFVSEGVSAKITSDNENGGVYALLSQSTLKKVAPALDKLKIIVYIINIYGIRRILSGYRKRYGLFVGMAAFLLLVWVSTLFVWKVNVVGTEMLSVKEVRAELSEMGVRPGILLSRIDRGSVSDRFLSAHPEFSWAALNFTGTTVSLNVRETEKKPASDTEKTNVLVAKSDGIVRSVLVYEGCAAVSPGTVVKKGDVLITGFISGSGLQITDFPPLRVGNARGNVRAEINGEVSVRVPISETVTEQTVANKPCGRKISVFGFDLKLGKTENAAESEESYITFFGFVEIPVTVTRYYAVSESETAIQRSAHEARLEAEARINELVLEVLSDAETVSLNVSYCEDEDGVTAKAEYVCITDITEKKNVG